MTVFVTQISEKHPGLTKEATRVLPKRSMDLQGFDLKG
jgi:hypothetical protein